MQKQLERKIFKEELPHKGKVVDWNKTEGIYVKFLYDGKIDYIYIEEYYGNNIIGISYNDSDIIKITTNNFFKCKFAKLINMPINGKNINVYKHNIGNIINGIKIIKQIRMRQTDKYTTKGYLCECVKHNHQFKKREIDTNEDIRCPYCGTEDNKGRKLLKGYNDIATTHPHLIKYFKNIEDTYTHTYGSHDKVWLICPDCGYEKFIEIHNFIEHGLCCRKCGDGFSYAEKLTFNMLFQLGIKFKPQLSKTTFKWCGKYRYDFYFKLNNEDYVIETHGSQHYQDAWYELEKTQLNDKLKKKLALSNGIKEENYIVIDCRYSELEFIKQNILDSKLNKLFNLYKIDWIKCETYAVNNIVKEVCNLWNLNKYLIKDISNIVGLSTDAISRYLYKGNRLEWCNYIKRRVNMKILCNNTGDIFNGFRELERDSEKTLGIKISRQKASKVCKGELDNYKGFTFETIN